MARADSVLVVDDDVAVREAIQLVVESEGYAVVTAADGTEALGYLNAGLRPGVILLDLRMPGMDGRAFRHAQAAERELASIPVVVLSGDSDARGVAQSLGLDALLKPVDIDQLLSIIQRHCAPSL